MMEISRFEGIPELTIGLDVSDRSLRYCELDRSGEIVGEGKLALRRAELHRYLKSQPCRARVALEAGGHAAWIRDEIEAAGHEALVANARDLAAVTGRSHRTDRSDARQIARLARVDARLLHPVELRSACAQADLFVIRARAGLVEVRTKLINMARGMTKVTGERLPDSRTDRFAGRMRDAMPDVLCAALDPLLAVLEKVSEQIAELDEELERLAERQYPETRWLTQVPGVGTLTALTYVLTIGNPRRFARSRDAGPVLGLSPGKRASGEQDPQLGISKCGDRYLRTLLIQCAHRVLGPHSPDSALRQWGLEHARGGKAAKRVAVTAVARRLAVLLHRLWVRQEVYRVFPMAVETGAVAQ